MLQVITSQTCSKMNSCISCNSDGNECFECLQGFFVTNIGSCKQCHQGCVRCLEFNTCQKCGKFFTLPNGENTCQYDYELFLLYGSVAVFLIIALIFFIYYVRLKCKNKEKMKITEERQWRSENDPRLTPAVSTRISRKVTAFTGESVNIMSSYSSSRRSSRRFSLKN